MEQPSQTDDTRRSNMTQASSAAGKQPTHTSMASRGSVETSGSADRLASSGEGSTGWFSFFPAEEQEEASTMARQFDQMARDYARLWVRIRSLEEQIQRQKERIHVLEKTQALGLTAHNLSGKQELGALQGHQHGVAGQGTASGQDLARHTPASIQTMLVPDLDPGPVSSEVEGQESLNGESFQVALNHAIAKFQQGAYGEAVIQLSKMQQAFASTDSGGAHLLWLARSWERLKKHDQARKLLKELIQGQPLSPWLAQAKFELAKLDLKQDRQQTAIQQLRDLIREHPYEEASEMARLELQKIRREL